MLAILRKSIVWAELINIQDQWKPGGRKLSGSQSATNIVNWKVLTESQSSSSGTFSQDTQHYSYYGESKER